MSNSPAGVNGVAVAAITAGVIFAWSAVKGYSISTTLKDILTGRNPSGQSPVNPVSPGGLFGPLLGSLSNSSGPGNASNVTSSVIANDAMQYVGDRYKWGGANPNTGADCSGFINWVLSHDLGLPIPGMAHGGFTGRMHGPTTFIWMAWPGKTRVKAADVSAGDLVIWLSHMGIATSNTEYVSALDTQSGIVVGPIHGGGPPGQIGTFWRLKSQVGSGGAIPRQAFIPHKGRL